MWEYLSKEMSLTLVEGGKILTANILKGIKNLLE